ncbi:a6ac5370-3514-4482-85c0-b1352636abbf [Sclerotinia trifoliorum]|uniref:A6ac5370-3514-4482-85c0-b1352636abbf n=1 Tax=Sclerotinia trifoliorum TaxID=28548 RepID=A0A8H2VZZ8_9HELO|nr:a6ac5370-3514-4482-85c0-b1352636abbf [Sclerotinia trifoliorum]
MLLPTGIPQSLNSIHKTFTNITPNQSLGIPISISLFAGLATTSLLFYTLRDIRTTTDPDVIKTTLSKTKTNSKSKSKIIPSPLITQIPTLSQEEISKLPYPPDIFPGARDIPSPYGSIRAYEFGPVDGPKILLIHGISTPCISLHSLATTLASSHGCRVLLFDLFGRGYSDGVADLPHDERLYSTLILLVLASSSLSWVADGFHILGFSMGGGIAVDFAVAFPGLVKDVILLAPSGLIREYHFGWMGKMMRKWWVPDGLAEWILRRRVRGGYSGVSNPVSSSSSSKDIQNENQQGQLDSELITIIPASPIAKQDIKVSFDDSLISPSIPYTTVGQVMRWQTNQHHGYANAFASSIMHASVSGRSDTWRKLWGSCGDSIMREKVKNSKREKILVVVGEFDDVILAEELKEDLKGVVESIWAGAGADGDGDGDGKKSMQFEEKIMWKVVEGAGHEFPITRGEEVAGYIGEFLFG